MECRNRRSDALCIELTFGIAGRQSKAQRDRVPWPAGRSPEPGQIGDSCGAYAIYELVNS